MDDRRTEAAAPGDAFPIAYAGGDGALAPLAVRNGVLNLSTLFLYRFWARTDVRDAIWSRITFDGDPLEYAGRPRELFFGALFIAFVILAPLALASFTVEVIRALWNQPLLFLWTPFIYLLARGLVGAAVFRARRYRMRRTLWRGLRFGQTGSAWPFALKSLGLFMLGVLSLGWTIPYRRKVLARHVWRRTTVGDKDFEFEDDGEGVYTLFALGWVLTVVGSIVIPFIASTITLAVVAFVSQSATDASGTPIPDAGDMTSVLIILPVLLSYGLILLFAQFAFSFYEAAMLRWIAAGVRLGGMRFTLSLDGWRFAMMRLSNALLMVFTLGLAQPIAQARRIRAIIGNLSATWPVDPAQLRAAPAHGRDGGEGLADAFDMGAI